MDHVGQGLGNAKVGQAGKTRFQPPVDGPPCRVSLLKARQLRKRDGCSQFVEPHGAVWRVGRPPLDGFLGRRGSVLSVEHVRP